MSKIDQFPSFVMGVRKDLENHPNISKYGQRVLNVFRNVDELEGILVTQLSVGYNPQELKVVRNLVLEEHKRLCYRLYRMVILEIFFRSMYKRSSFDDFDVSLY